MKEKNNLKAGIARAIGKAVLLAGLSAVASGAIPSVIAEQKNNPNVNEIYATYLESQRKANQMELEQMVENGLKKPRTFGKVLNEYPKEAVKIIKRNWAGNQFRKDGLEDAIKRAEPYMGNMRDNFSKYGIPEELYPLGIVESQFMDAESSAGAGGPFQIMPGTAVESGAIISESWDDRKNPVIASEIAARILRKYFAETENWDLALARYNSKSLPGSFLDSLDENGKILKIDYFQHLGKIYQKERRFRKNVKENLYFMIKLEEFNRLFPKFRDDVKNAERNFSVYQMPDSPWEYRVKKGDSLWKISEEYLNSQNYGIPVTPEIILKNASRIKMYASGKIIPGRKIKIKHPETLDEFERILGRKLLEENRQAIDPNKQIPSGASIVIRKY